jgi:hypothetical protein
MRVLSWGLAAMLAAAGELQACDGTDPAAWAQSHRELRSTKGHFSGGAWSPAVDAWGGAKHRVMQCLGRHATAKAMRAAPLRRLMGAPDEVLRCPSPACADALQKAEWEPAAPAGVQPAELWLYDWRGRHDRLVLLLAAGAVRGSGWLYARE